MGKVIAFANAKGGVGKTSVTTEVAFELSEAGFKVGVVDLDPQGNAGKHMLGGKISEVGIRDALLGTPWGETIYQAVHPWKNCVVFPGTRALEEIESDLKAKTMLPQMALAKLLNQAKKHLDYILIDTPPRLGFHIVLSLSAADGFVVPTDCSVYAVDGIKAMLKHIAVIREELNPDLEFLGTVVTGFQKGNSIAIRDTVKDLENVVGKEKILGKINHTVKNLEAQRAHTALSAKYPDIASSTEYKRICSNLTEAMQ